MSDFDRRDDEGVQEDADRLQAMDPAGLSPGDRRLHASRLAAAKAHADVAVRQEAARQALERTERTERLDAARQAQAELSPLDRAKRAAEQLDDADRARLAEWLARWGK